MFLIKGDLYEDIFILKNIQEYNKIVKCAFIEVQGKFMVTKNKRVITWIFL